MSSIIYLFTNSISQLIPFKLNNLLIIDPYWERALHFYTLLIQRSLCCKYKWDCRSFVYRNDCMHY